MLQNGKTALIWACVRGHKEVAEMLVKAGADVNAVDKVSEIVLRVWNDDC